MGKRAQSYGFTLIELAIVLTIIGLIVGGILVGHHLILGAKLQRTVGQMEKIVAAVYAFKGKYNWIPGDMIAHAAQDNGLTSGPCFITDTVMVSMTDINLLPDGCQPYWWPLTGNDLIDEGTTETADFYAHLSRANLIEGLYGRSLWPPTSDPARVWMEPALKKGVIYPTTCSGSHCFILGGNFLPGPPSAPAAYKLAQFTPAESFSIDRKIDDGNAPTGRVSVLLAYQLTSRLITTGAITSTIDFVLSQECCWLPDGSGPDNNCAGESYYHVVDDSYQCMIQVKW